MDILEIQFPESQIDNQLVVFERFLNDEQVKEDFALTPKERKVEKGAMGVGQLTGEILLTVKDIGIGVISAIVSYASATRQKVTIKHGETEASFEGKNVNELMDGAAAFVKKIELAKKNKNG